MSSLDQISRRISTTTELKSIVRTMKALSAVGVRQFEKSLDDLEKLASVLEKGFQAVYQSYPELFRISRGEGSYSEKRENRTGVVVLGSDQGLCGHFNEAIFQRYLSFREARLLESENRMLLVLGHRILAKLEDANLHADESLSIPLGLNEVSESAREIVSIMDSWIESESVDRIFILYHLAEDSGDGKEIAVELIYPLHSYISERISKKESPFHNGPFIHSGPEVLFEELLHQYLVLTVSRCLTASLVQENKHRLISMQSAEKQIGDKLNELKSEYQTTRQEEITSELLDIVSGYEVLQES